MSTHVCSCTVHTCTGTKLVCPHTLHMQDTKVCTFVLRALVCTHAALCVCTHTHMHAGVHIRIYLQHKIRHRSMLYRQTCTYMHIHANPIHSFRNVCMCPCIHTSMPHVHTDLQTHWCVRIDTCACTCLCVHMCVHGHAHLILNTLVCTMIPLRTHKVFLYAYTHMCTCKHTRAQAL